MNTAQKVIDKFGGQTALAEMLGKGQTTIAHWAKTGVIPSKWHSPVLNAARLRSISLSSDDLIFREAAEEAVVEPITSVALRPEKQTHLSPVPISNEPSATLSPFLFYSSPDGSTKVWVLVEGETVWATRKGDG